MLKIGIIGPARSGKTTVYNAVAAAHADVGGYLGRDAVRRAVVRIPDERLGRLREIFGPPKEVHAEIEYFDFPPLTGDAKEMLALPPALHELDALIVVLREFGENPDPARDWRAVNDELVLTDLGVIEKRMSRLTKEVESGHLDHKLEHDALVRCGHALDEGKPLRTMDLSTVEMRQLRGYGFLSLMPALAVVNAPDEGSSHAEAEWTALLDTGPRTLVRVLRGRLEAELIALDPADRTVFMADYGLAASALDNMVAACFSLLGLITFFTGTVDKEVRAWTVHRGATAPEAAGVIHSDFAQGFIRAEVTPTADLFAAGSIAAARKAGKTRLEGKEYIVQDGDFILFRFHV